MAQFVFYAEKPKPKKQKKAGKKQSSPPCGGSPIKILFPMSSMTQFSHPLTRPRPQPHTSRPFQPKCKQKPDGDHHPLFQSSVFSLPENSFFFLRNFYCIFEKATPSYSEGERVVLSKKYLKNIKNNLGLSNLNWLFLKNFIRKIY